MMLDEAITLLKFNNKHIADLKNDDLQQIAEWLEDYKRLAKETEQDIYERAYKDGLDKGLSDGHFFGYKKAIDDFANGISECLGVENATKYGNKNAEQQRMSYDTLMKYEIADAIEDIAEQLKAGDGE